MHASVTAVYARVSVATDESVSIAQQVSMAEAECVRRGWPAPRVFADEGISGSRDVARPARDQLEALIVAGKVDAVIAKSVDRVARSVIDFHRIGKECQDAGTALIILDVGVDTSTPAGSMVLGVLAQFAEFEAATIAARVRMGNIARRRMRRAPGGRPPFGVMNVPGPSGGLVRAVNPGTAPIVRRMAAEVLEGRALSAIARGLNADGVPAPGIGALRVPNPEGAPAWRRSDVHRVLSSPAVAGMLPALGGVVREADGTRYVDPAAAVLDLEAWRQVSSMIAARSSGAERRWTEPADRLLLDEIARCGGCLAPMRRNTARGTYPTYTCGRRGTGACPAPASASVGKLEAYVLGVVDDAIGAHERTRLENTADPAVVARTAALRADVAGTLTAMASAGAEEVAGLAEQLAALRRAQNSLADADAASISVVVGTGVTWREHLAAAEQEGRRAHTAALADVVAAVTVSQSPDRSHDLSKRVEVVF